VLVRLLSDFTDEKEESILSPLHSVVLALVTTYMGYSVAEQYRRSHRSWQAIVSRLSFKWETGTPLHANNLSSTTWVHPWTAFRDAGVMMEMVDYMERNSSQVDTVRPDTLRVVAIRMRFESLKALTRRFSVR
jgi:hypothetical protein